MLHFLFIGFFLTGISVSAKQAIKTAKQINVLFDEDIKKIANLGRVRFSCEQIFEYMRRLPQVTVSVVSKELKMTSPTARNALNNMVLIGVLQEVSGKKRDKIYVYRKYLNILEDGAEPF